MKGLPLQEQESTKQTGVKYAQFSLVGVSNALVDLGVLNLLLLLAPTRDPELLVGFNIVALVLTNANSYLWNTLWTFRRQARHNAKQVSMFGAQALLNYRGCEPPALGASLRTRGLHRLLRADQRQRG
jgi:putative flippase GtrA